MNSSTIVHKRKEIIRKKQMDCIQLDYTELSHRVS